MTALASDCEKVWEISRKPTKKSGNNRSNCKTQPGERLKVAENSPQTQDVSLVVESEQLPLRFVHPSEVYRSKQGRGRGDDTL